MYTNYFKVFKFIFNKSTRIYYNEKVMVELLSNQKSTILS